MLRGGHLKGLGEIIIKTDVQWRLIGRYERSNETFTLTMICYHKERVYIPHDALEIAMERWKEMKNGLKGIMLNAHPTELGFFKGQGFPGRLC